MIPVIICGGHGTKLWPISREHKPKHFLPLFNGKSLFQINYEGLRAKYQPEEIFVSTNKDQMAMALAQEPEIPEKNFILEPEMRNQGPATGLIAASLYLRGFADEPFMLIQVDVLREPFEKCLQMMEEVDPIARKETKYITAGIKPDYAVMGVDYLIKGKRVSEEGAVGIFEVDRFVWRGNKEDTESLLKESNALIHTNHTCMTPRNLLEMLKKYKPEWYEPLMNIAHGEDINTEFVKMPPGPLEDVTQKVYEDKNALVVEMPFRWTDFGTFESVAKYQKENGMYQVPDNVVDMTGKDNFIMLDDTNKVVALVGVDNLIVVDTGDALLICDKSQSGQVGEALKEVKKRNFALT